MKLPINPERDEWRRKMALYSGLIEKFVFRKDEDGSTVFYPWGAMGQAYSTTSQDVRERLNKFYIKAFLPIPFLAMGVQHIPIVLVLMILALYTGLYVFAMCRLLKSLPDIRLVASTRSVPTFAAKFSYLAISGGLVGSLVFVALGTFMAVSGDSEAMIGGAFGAVFFGSCAAAYGWLLFVKLRLGSTQKH
jgi:uncharacterized membrane protein